MARPRKEGMEYFPHDTDASNDKKIEALRLLYGNDGYAFYFILLEMIYKEPTFELDVSDAETVQILAKKISVSVEKFESMLATAIKRECFDPDSYYEKSVLTSTGIKKRANVVIEKREKMRQRYENKASTKELVSDAETPPESAQSKSKVKDKVKDKAVINKYPEDSQYYRMSVYFYKKICEWTDKVSEPNHQKWADDFRKLVELSKRDLSVIKDVIDFATADSFWQANILSPATLRKQFEKLWVKMDKQRTNNVTPINRRAVSGKPLLPVVPSNQGRRLSEEERAELRRKAELLDAGNREIL